MDEIFILRSQVQGGLLNETGRKKEYNFPANWPKTVKNKGFILSNLSVHPRDLQLIRNKTQHKLSPNWDTDTKED